jgi:hypothetical protein
MRKFSILSTDKFWNSRGNKFLEINFFLRERNLLNFIEREKNFFFLAAENFQPALLKRVSDLSHGEEWNDDENAIGFGLSLRTAKILTALDGGGFEHALRLVSVNSCFCLQLRNFLPGLL